MIDFSDVKVNGLHYVREIRNQWNERVGYLLVDNRNKPIKSVFKYLQRKRKRDGSSINTVKRICYDLTYFYDYMLIEKMDIETIDYQNMYDFIDSYFTRDNRTKESTVASTYTR